LRSDAWTWPLSSASGGDDSLAQVRRFHGEHAGVILLSQPVELPRR
jgi:hypothetical protein